MPMYIDENDVIQRITFNDFVAEKPLKESAVRKLVNSLWFLVFGGVR